MKNKTAYKRGLDDGRRDGQKTPQGYIAEIKRIIKSSKIKGVCQ